MRRFLALADHVFAYSAIVTIADINVELGTKAAQKLTERGFK